MWQNVGLVPNKNVTLFKCDKNKVTQKNVTIFKPTNVTHSGCDKKMSHKISVTNFVTLSKCDKMHCHAFLTDCHVFQPTSAGATVRTGGACRWKNLRKMVVSGHFFVTIYSSYDLYKCFGVRGWIMEISSDQIKSCLKMCKGWLINLFWCNYASIDVFFLPPPPPR